MLVKDQFGIILNLQKSPIPQTSFLVGTFLPLLTAKQLQLTEKAKENKEYLILCINFVENGAL